MAIDLQAIDYLVTSTVPNFSDWTPNQQASVLATEATLGSGGEVSFELIDAIGNGKSAAQYRKLTMTISGIDIASDTLANYISENRIQFRLDALYAINTSSEEMYESILCIINPIDITVVNENSIQIEKIIPTWNKAMQTGIVKIINNTESQIVVSNIISGSTNATLLRSADVSNEQAAQILNTILRSTDPQMFKFYRLSNILDGLGIVVPSGREIKFKPIREGNDVVEIQTNYREAMPCIYINEPIDITTD